MRVSERERQTERKRYERGDRETVIVSECEREMERE